MGRSPVGQEGKGVFDFSASLTANGTERKRAGKNVHLEIFLAEFLCCSSESRSQAKKAEYTPPKAEGSHVCSVGKHFWKYENVHLCQTDATDKFTRRKCPCFCRRICLKCDKNWRNPGQ